MSIFFTADLHLGHHNIIKHTKRPWASVGEMDDALLASINAVVGKSDVLWILGDFSWKKPELYRQLITCSNVNILRGNHDKTGDLAAFPKYGCKFHLSHYPHASWSGRSRGGVHLYGHAHGSLEDTLDIAFPGRHAMDVGMDNAIRRLGAYRPFSLLEVLKWVGIA